MKSDLSHVWSYSFWLFKVTGVWKDALQRPVKISQVFTPSKDNDPIFCLQSGGPGFIWGGECRLWIGHNWTWCGTNLPEPDWFVPRYWDKGGGGGKYKGDDDSSMYNGGLNVWGSKPVMSQIWIVDLAAAAMDVTICYLQFSHNHSRTGVLNCNSPFIVWNKLSAIWGEYNTRPIIYRSWLMTIDIPLPNSVVTYK